MSEKSRQIGDEVEFERLEALGSAFPVLRIIRNMEEVRGGKDRSRQALVTDLSIMFYRHPEVEKPDVELFRDDILQASTLIVRTLLGTQYYEMFVLREAEHMHGPSLKTFAELNQAESWLVREMTLTLTLAQISIAQPLYRAPDSPKAALERALAANFRDPHERDVGAWGRLMDRLVERRYR